MFFMLTSLLWGRAMAPLCSASGSFPAALVAAKVREEGAGGTSQCR